MSGMAGLILARRMRSGRWRLYEVSDQALVQSRGPNAIARVVHDPETEAIVSFTTIDAAEIWVRAHHMTFDGEWPKCSMCGYYYGLAEPVHIFESDCERQREYDSRQRLGSAA